METSATIMEIQVDIRRGGGGVGNSVLEVFCDGCCTGAVDIYSLSRLMRNMSHLYPSSHFE